MSEKQFEVFAWVCFDPKTEDESLCAIMSTDGPPFQAITPDKEVIMMMKPYFTQMAKASGKTIRLVRFKNTEMLEEIAGAAEFQS